MKETDDKYDIKFRKLITESDMESPSNEFTANVMGRIEKLNAAAETSTEDSQLSRWYWSIGITLLVVLGFSIMYIFDVNFLPKEIKPILSPVFAGVFNSFKDIFASVEVSSTTIVIILGFILLVVLERVLNKLKLTKNFYLSF